MSRPQILTFLYPLLQFGILHPSSLQQKYTHRSLRRATSSTYTMDKLFIDALVRACSCREHAQISPTQPSTAKSLYIYHKARRRSVQQNPLNIRSVHTYRAHTHHAAAQASISREEYIQMLDYYSFEPPGEKAQNGVRPTSFLALPPPDDYNYKPVLEELHVPDESVTSDLSLPEEAVPAAFEAPSSKEGLAVERLISILNDEDNTQETIFQAYSALPVPGVAYLSIKVCRLLFRRISVVERKSIKTMLRYLSVVEDMKAADIPMIAVEWNSAIAFTGRCLTKITATEVELAIRTWKEMEQAAKVQSGSVTFTILFDIATKAGKFVLAEMILKEMRARNLSLNRFGRVGIIYYHGLRGDGDAVRKAYKSFVQEGEIVDTVVMNCVIASLIRAGEPSAAFHVYERMKEMYSSKTGFPIPAQDWKAVRELGRVLARAARIYCNDPEGRQRVQSETCLAPNLHTYAIFIEHHVVTGELRRITALLEEMLFLRVPMHGRIFVKLFKGFAIHGGVRYTSWTHPRLESVWVSLLAVLDDGASPNVVVRKWMVVWVVKAFRKCYGRRRALEVWAELGTRWEASAAEEQAVSQMLRDALYERPVGGDWG